MVVTPKKAVNVGSAKRPTNRCAPDQHGDHPLKIDIVVHGRFNAFDLTRALSRLGHDVRIYTNYPKFAAQRFGVPPDRVRSFLGHGLMTRAYRRIGLLKRVVDPEPYFHQSFGSWAAGCVRPDADLLYVFSGVAEEILRLPREHKPKRWVVRASAHIREQYRLLCDEEVRVGFPIDKPSKWMLAREEREYALADRVVVLSSFAHNSFMQQGLGADRLMLLHAGVETQQFRASP